MLLGVVEDVVSHDPPVDVDVAVHKVLQKLRTRSRRATLCAMCQCRLRRPAVNTLTSPS